MGSRKTVQTVRNEGESEAKVRTSNAFAEESMSGKLFSFRYRDGRDMDVEESVFSAEVRKGTLVDLSKNVYPEHETFRWCSAPDAEKLMKWETNSRAVKMVMENVKK